MEEVRCTPPKFLGASLSSSLREERVFDPTTRRVQTAYKMAEEQRPVLVQERAL